MPMSTQPTSDSLPDFQISQIPSPPCAKVFQPPFGAVFYCPSTTQHTAVTITGANGADALDGGAGVDSFVQADGSSVIWTAQTGVVGGLPFPIPGINVIVAGGVFTFGNSTDVITNFAAGAGGDGINVTTANNLTTLAAAAATNALNVASNYLVRGAWNAGARTFTQANAGADALILFNAQNAAFENAGNDNFIIATGVGATLVAANFT